ncbi:hypothetical protein C8Q75DRAFT_807956 [Abortiporus biennis]|nr:hypothetical protein C8Q75DRAFT_809638 [Abortiporus biennis]KAI0786867.1 hypothetical protein C8Q75DRAFT_807956 [Abortiporus biennis]
MSARFGVSAFAFLLWDTIIHLSDEIEYIWKSPNSWVKFVYIFIRHFGLLSIGSLLVQALNENNHLGFTQSSCAAFIIYESVISEALVVAVELIFVVRIYAFYERSRFISIFIVFLFLAEIIATITTIIVSSPKEKFNVEIGCVVVYAPPSFNVVWIVSLIIQTILFLLTLVKYFQSVKGSLGRHTLLYVFIRDGTWAFADIFVILLMNLVFFEVRAKQAPLFYKYLLSIMSCTGSHVLVNLRRLAAGNQGSSSETTTAQTEGPVIFAPGQGEEELTTHIDVQGDSQSQSTGVINIVSSQPQLQNHNKELGKFGEV